MVSQRSKRDTVLEEFKYYMLEPYTNWRVNNAMEWQKLDAFRRFLFPRLPFAHKVMFPGTIRCRKLDTSLRAIIKHGLHLPHRTCTKYLYLSQALGGLGIPSVEDESHVVRAAQAFKFLADSRDPCILDVAIYQLAEAVQIQACPPP